MDISEQNALRSIARQAWIDIQEEWKTEKATTVHDREKISRRILLEYEGKAAPRFTIIQIIYFIGVIRGVIKER